MFDRHRYGGHMTDFDVNILPPWLTCGRHMAAIDMAAIMSAIDVSKTSLFGFLLLVSCKTKDEHLQQRNFTYSREYTSGNLRTNWSQGFCVAFEYKFFSWLAAWQSASTLRLSSWLQNQGDKPDTYILYYRVFIKNCVFSLEFCDFSELCQFCCSAGFLPA